MAKLFSWTLSILLFAACGDESKNSSTCVKTSDIESCNNLDDNCNGQIDEGFAAESLTLGTVTPTDASNNIELNTVVSAEFSRALEPATINTNTVQVTNPSGPVSGTLSVSDNKILFTPDPKWPLGNSLQIKLTKQVKVKATDCGALDQEFSSKFTTREGAWSQLATVVSKTDTSNRIVGMSGVVDPQGEATTAWKRSTNFQMATSIEASHNATGNGWSSVTPLDSHNNETIQPAAIAAGKNGQAHAVWYHNIGGVPAIFQSQLVNGTWSTKATLEAQASAVPTAFATSRGDGIGGAWTRRNTSTLGGDLAWARVDTTNTWGSSELIGTSFEINQGPSEMQGKISDDGTVVLVWLRETADNIFLDYVRYLDGAWSTVNTAATLPKITSTFQLGIDRSGNAFLVWVTGQISAFNVYASRLAKNEATWREPQVLTTGSAKDIASNSSLRLAVSSSGNAVASWISTGSSLAYASVFDGATWSEATKVSETTFYEPCNVTMDASNNAILVMTGNANDLVSARYLASSKTWEEYKELSAQGPNIFGGFNRNCDVASNAAGELAVVWWRQLYSGMNPSGYAVHALRFR